MINEYDLVLVAYENEQENTLRKALETIKSHDIKVAVIIGPEGGIEENEVEFLMEKGAKIISLGNRILRTETVAMVVTSILMYEVGDLS